MSLKFATKESANQGQTHSPASYRSIQISANLPSLDHRAFSAFITSQDKVATDPASCDKWLEQQSRKLNCCSVGASRKHLIDAAPVVLKVLLG